MLGWFAETTLVALVLAVVAAGVGRVRPIGPTARHLLWLAVLVKLMTPPLVSWPWAVPWPDLSGPMLSIHIESVRDAPVVVAVAAVEPGEDDSVSPVPIPSAAAVDFAVVEPCAAPDPLPVPAANLGASVPIEPMLLAAWLVVTALLGAGQAWRIRRFCRRLRLAIPAPDDLVAEAERIAGSIGVRAPSCWSSPSWARRCSGAWAGPGSCSPRRWSRPSTATDGGESSSTSWPTSAAATTGSAASSWPPA